MKKKVKNVINLIYEKNQNIDDFKEYLINIYEEINDYSKLKKEEKNKISNYFIRILEKNEKIIDNKDKLINQYKDNSIIKYEDFAKIIKQYEIVLEPIIMDYLLYKMKCGLPLDGLSLDDLDIKIFIDYLDQIEDKSIAIDNYNEKENIGENNNNKIGIDMKNKTNE